MLTRLLELVALIHVLCKAAGDLPHLPPIRLRTLLPGWVSAANTCTLHIIYMYLLYTHTYIACRKTKQHNTRQHNAIPCNTMQHKATQHTMQHNATQHHATQCNTMQHKATQCDTTQHNTTQCNTTQRNTTQPNPAQHNADAQCNTNVDELHSIRQVFNMYNIMSRKLYTSLPLSYRGSIYIVHVHENTSK